MLITVRHEGSSFGQRMSETTLILTLTGSLSKFQCCPLSFVCIELQKHVGHEFICRHLFRLMEIVDEERRFKELEIIFYRCQIKRIRTRRSLLRQPPLFLAISGISIYAIDLLRQSVARGHDGTMGR